MKVDYPPGGKSDKHRHAGSVFAYVLSGAIRSENSATGPSRVYQAGESFFEPAGSEHTISENASQKDPASLLAMFVAPDEAVLKTSSIRTGTLSMIEESIKAKDGLSIFLRSWHPAGRARGVVVIAHGFNSHSGYYLWVGEQLAGMGLSVYPLDLRGRGRSDGERFYVRSLRTMSAISLWSSGWQNRASRVCRSSCSATAQVASHHASTCWITKPNCQG